jgi:sarcosine oxidase gamma subunit
MEGKEGLAWWTPDEWTILNESRVSEEVRKAIRAKKE